MKIYEYKTGEYIRMATMAEMSVYWHRIGEGDSHEGNGVIEGSELADDLRGMLVWIEDRTGGNNATTTKEN